MFASHPWRTSEPKVGSRPTTDYLFRLAPTSYAGRLREGAARPGDQAVRSKNQIATPISKIAKTRRLRRRPAGLSSQRWAVPAMPTIARWMAVATATCSSVRTAVCGSTARAGSTKHGRTARSNRPGAVCPLPARESTCLRFEGSKLRSLMAARRQSQLNEWQRPTAKSGAR